MGHTAVPLEQVLSITCVCSLGAVSHSLRWAAFAFRVWYPRLCMQATAFGMMSVCVWLHVTFNPNCTAAAMLVSVDEGGVNLSQLKAAAWAMMLCAWRRCA
jgi:hypothetical protein